MKGKKINDLHMAFLIILMSIMPLPVIPVSTQEIDVISQQVIELSEQLELSNQQTLEVEKIVKMAQNQAEMDRESYKDNALALIEAAKRRRQMTDTHIEALLEPGQKENFDLLKSKRKLSEELFILKEGLLLTEDQTVRVKEILDDYRKRFEANKEAFREKMKGRGGGMHGGAGGKRGGMGKGSGGMPGGGRGDAMLQAMQERENEKAKEIKRILTKDQQEMYKPIRKMQKKELQNRMKERRKEFRKRRY